MAIDLTEEGATTNQIFKNRMIEANQNMLIAITGKTGSGKSYASLRIAELWYRKQFKKELPRENICFSIEELMERLVNGNLKRGDVLILEEAGTSMGNLDFASQAAKAFNYVLQSFRSRNISIIMNLPFLTMLNKTSRTLLHARLETLGIDTATNKCYVKPLMLQVNQSSGKVYIHFPEFLIDGHYEKITKLSFTKPSPELIEIYEKKKLEFVNNLSKQVLNDLIKKRVPGAKPLTPFQDELLDYLKANPGQTYKEISKNMNKPISTVTQNLYFIRNKGINIDIYLRKGDILPIAQITPT